MRTISRSHNGQVGGVKQQEVPEELEKKGKYGKQSPNKRVYIRKQCRNKSSLNYFGFTKENRHFFHFYLLSFGEKITLFCKEVCWINAIHFSTVLSLCFIEFTSFSTLLR